MKIVSDVVEQDMADDRVFINRLLVNTEVFNIVQTIQEENKSEQTVSSDNDEHKKQNMLQLLSLIQGEIITWRKRKLRNRRRKKRRS